MARITLYKVNDKISVENNNIGIFNILNYLPIQEELTVELTPNWVKNINQLTNELTIYLEGRYPLREYNYLRIQDLGGVGIPNVYLFFITGYEEIGTNQVKYFLQLDTLNTYRPQTSNPFIDYENSVGLVLREHKDRFIAKVNDESIANKNNIKSIEDITIKGGVVKSENTEKETTRQRLVLRKYGDDGKCVPLYFWKPYIENGTKNYGTTANRFRIPLGWGFQTYGSGKTTIYHGQDIALEWNSLVSTGVGFYYRFTSTENYFVIELIEFDGNGSDIQVATTTTSGWIRGTLGSKSNQVYYISRTGIDSTNIYVERGSTNLNLLSPSYNLGINRDDDVNSPETFFLFDEIVRDFSYINKNDVNNIKMIELFDEFVNETTPNLIYGLLPFGTGLPKYEDTIKETYFKRMNTFIWSENILDLRVPFNDPKLYNSQFQPTFLYLSGESIPVKWENFNYQTLLPKFEVSLNDNDYSKALLNVPSDPYPPQTNPAFEINDFVELIKIVDLNNDIPVIITEAEKYIQTLQQNDLKMIQLQEAAATRNLQKQGTSILTSVAVGAASGALVGGGVASIPAAAVGAAAGLITGAVSFYFSLKEAKDQSEIRRIEYNNKLINIQNSLINVVGSPINLKKTNDLDRPKLFIYELLPDDKKYLDDHFFYYGYKTLEIKKPVLRTREKFDFKQIIWRELKSDYNIPVDIKNDILKRWAEGVTIFHNIGSLYGYYDYEQKYENREVSLL